MSGTQTTTQQGSSESVNQIPQWVQNAGQQNYGLAQSVANQPFQQYQGQMVADVAPQTQQAWNLAANSGQVGQPAQQAAQAGYLNTLAQTPQSINPQTLAGTNLQPYMNPYTQSVINQTLPLMQQQLGLNQIGNQSQAAGAGAYGGSRQGIQQGVTQAQGAMDMGQMAAQLNQANYAQAQQGATGDIQRNLQAQQANQAAGLSQEGLANQAAQGLGGLGIEQMQRNAGNFSMLTSAGGQEQQQAQNDINAQLAKFQQAWAYPQQQLGIMESALGMTPYNTATSGTSASTTQQTQNNPGAMALGGLQTLGSLFSAPAGGISAMSGFGNLFGMNSDRSMKTDITRIGKQGKLPIYSFRYKGDPKHYPKVVGPMAQDVAKLAPHAVKSIGGKLAINANAMTPPSSPGVAKAIGMLGRGTPGRLSPNATPPSRGILGTGQKLVPGAPIIGALGG